MLTIVPPNLVINSDVGKIAEQIVLWLIILDTKSQSLFNVKPFITVKSFAESPKYHTRTKNHSYHPTISNHPQYMPPYELIISIPIQCETSKKSFVQIAWLLELPPHPSIFLPSAVLPGDFLLMIIRCLFSQQFFLRVSFSRLRGF